MLRYGRAVAALLLSAGFTAAVWAAEPPVAVSPGDASKLAVIADPCPTFSWGEVDGAKSYELVVYRFEQTGEAAEPVLQQSFAGSVDGWTPALDQCLEWGGRYAWSVRAGGSKEASEWSAPSLFQVSAAPSLAEVEAAMEVLRRYTAAGRAAAKDGRESSEAVQVRGESGERVAEPPELPSENSLSHLRTGATESAEGVNLPRAAVPLEEIGISTVVSTESVSGDGGDAIAVRAEYFADNSPPAPPSSDQVVGYLGVAVSTTTAGEFDGFPQLKPLSEDEIAVLGFSANDSADNYGVVGVGTLRSNGARFLKTDLNGTIVNEVFLASGGFAVVAVGPIQVDGEAQIFGPIRHFCPSDMDSVGTWCIDKAVKPAADAGPSIDACHLEQKSLCPLEALVHCDQRNIQAGTTGSCGDRTDADGAVIRTSSIDIDPTGTVEVFDRFIDYIALNNRTGTSAKTEDREFFCCKRVSQ